jgi:hypothetical protein
MKRFSLLRSSAAMIVGAVLLALPGAARADVAQDCQWLGEEAISEWLAELRAACADPLEHRIDDIRAAVCPVIQKKKPIRVKLFRDKPLIVKPFPEHPYVRSYYQFYYWREAAVALSLEAVFEERCTQQPKVVEAEILPTKAPGRLGAYFVPPEFLKTAEQVEVEEKPRSGK